MEDKDIEQEKPIKLMLSGGHGQYGIYTAPCGFPDMWFDESTNTWREVNSERTSC